jgi:hypothetical protein
MPVFPDFKRTGPGIRPLQEFSLNEKYFMCKGYDSKNGTEYQMIMKLNMWPLRVLSRDETKDGPPILTPYKYIKVSNSDYDYKLPDLLLIKNDTVTQKIYFAASLDGQGLSICAKS